MMQDDIAVVGFSFKLPQGVEDVASFWHVLENRKNLMTDWPESRINVGSIKSNSYNKVQCRGGYFIDEDPAVFDAPFFSVTAKEAASMDPMQRWTLEASYRAFENAGIPVETLRGSRTAVFSASMSDDYSRMTAQDPEDHPRMAATGTFASIIPNRVSWYFDLRGLSAHVDSACSSSLLAVDMACQAIKSGDASAALVTSSNLILGPAIYQLLSAQGFLSPDSRCYSFDHRANGYARGEGIIALVIKPIADAVRDGDMIRAVIRSSASNQDGRTPGLTQPSSRAQESLMRQVYEKAKLPFDQTRYVEAHGTGTPVGDPIEMAAIGRVFCSSRSAEEPLYVGSVKANIGHLEGSSGLAGVLKSILMLEKGIIPPNALFEKMNPNIDADSYHIEVPSTPKVWPCSGLRRVSVNSFGFGGTNTHVVIDDAYHYLQNRGLAGNHNTVRFPVAHHSPTNGTSQVDSDGVETNGANGHHPADSPRLLVWTAADENAVARMTTKYEAFYKTHVARDAGKLERLAFSLGSRRGKLLWRQFAVVQSARAELPPAAAKPVRSSGPDEVGLGFVFTGQGAQYASMGLSLMEYPVFSEVLEKVDEIYHGLGCKWSLFDELRNRDNIDSPDRSQPLSTALQIALVELLKSFGIVPKAVVGHSSGEIAAAYAIGALSLHSACKVSYFRGQLAGQLKAAAATGPAPRSSAMIAVNLAEDAVSAFLEELGWEADLSVACVNSPVNCTLSGSEAAVDAVKQALDKEGVFAQKLKTGVAYHSPFMSEIANEYLALMGSLEGSSTSAGDGMMMMMMVSSVTGNPVLPAVLAKAQYWVQNMVSQVRFSDAVQVLAQGASSLGMTDLVEVGPHAALRRPVQDSLGSFYQTAAGQKQRHHLRYFSALHKGRPAIETTLELAGRLFCHGHPVSTASANRQSRSHPPASTPPPFLVDAPEYPFDHSKRYWNESRLSRAFRLRTPVAGETLGARFCDWNPLSPRWRGFLSVESAPWTGDHVVGETVIYPGAGMLIMAIEAAQHMCRPDRLVAGYHVREASFVSPIVVGRAWEDRTETVVQLRPVRRLADEKDAGAWSDVTIYSYAAADDHWTECFRAVVQVQYEDVVGRGDALRERRWEEERVAEEYRRAGEQCTRPIDSHVFYGNAADHGITWGSWFQVLDDILWDGGARTLGRVDLAKSPRHRTTSLVHPAVLDAAFHALRVSTTHGLALASSSTNIPVRLVDAWFAPSGWQQPDTRSIRYLATSRGEAGRGRSEGAVCAVADDGTVLCTMGKLVMAAVSGSSTAQADTPGRARKLLCSIDWKPQLSLLSPAQLAVACDAGTFPDKDEATMLLHYRKLRFVLDQAILDALDALSSRADRIPDSMRRHVEWMKHHAAATRLGAPTAAAARVSGQELAGLVREIETIRPGWKLHATVARELLPILTGRSDPLQTIFGSDQADAFYADMFESVCDHRLRAFLGLASHENPALRILEVGAGTGGMTGRVLGALLGLEGEGGGARFAEYTYTDVSPAFFERAGTRWGRVAEGGRMAFRTFDMKASPESQGLERGRYDMVVAGSVLHATEDLVGAVRNVKRLLRAGGKLLLLEAIAPDDVASNFTFGLVPGWWGAREEWRGMSPAIPEEQWDVVLREAGFSGNDLCLRDYKSDECHLFSVIVSTAGGEEEGGATEAEEEQPVVVVVGDADDERQMRLAGLVCERLPRGQSARVVALDHVEDADLTADDTVVCIAETSRPLLAALSESRFHAIQHLVKRSQKLLWATRVENEQAPAYSIVQGLMRTVRAEEVDKRLVTLAIESRAADDNPTTCAEYIARAFCASFGPSASPARESEYIVRGGMLTTGRVIEDVAQNEMLHSLLHPQLQHKAWLSGPAAKLAVGTTKTLESLRLVEDDDHGAPLGPREVEIEAKAWAVNFRDVLVALGRIDDGGLGLDCAGVVTRVGRACGSDAVRAGDRVCMVSPNCMRAYPRADSRAVLRIPDGLSFEEAASVLIPGMTAYYGLLEVARLRRGEKILIHSAAGSTGQMAVWMAKTKGAEVFATTSSDDKKRFLRDTMGIPEDHIFYSRDTSFARGIKRVTGGRGVDVVLNSLSGDGLRASWECVAPFGRFVEIAEADIRSNAMLPMGSFAHNVSFSAVDLRHIAQADLDLTQRLLRGTLGLLAERKIKHPGPLHRYPVSEVERAFRHLQGGKNIGRVMITLDRTDVVPQLLFTRPSWTFDPHATYLVAGGSGGLGRAIAKWMATRGARHMLLPSRSGGTASPAASALLSDLRARGVNVLAPRCDMADDAALADLLASWARRNMPPVKGVINAAMVLQDAVFSNMTHAQWELAIRSKVCTTWNLHRRLGPDADFFVMLSSLIGVLGGMGQANYAAGCAFQDALARRRVRDGKTGSVSIDVGWMRSIGIVAERAEYQRNLKTAEDMHRLSEEELLGVLDVVCDPARREAVVGERDAQVLFGLRTPDEFHAKGREPPELLDRPLFAAFAHHQNSDGRGEGPVGSLAAAAVADVAGAFRRAADEEGRVRIVVQALAGKLARAMAIAPEDVEFGKPLSSYGVDSLMAVELRNWIGKDFGANVAVFDIMGNVPIARIGELVVARSRVGKS
ncbi:fatty acid synthase S-acetyltransferase [Lasiosphaeria hispida]|uniref:Fatty acid synthase S-acetyltransferase n=1 Tax=Lasiosphaeria hispida TaxID=260671 RepID=A0AAJ0H818_9PEZI|nr:fatty acid synthase S-acetyltransferase [Lasiosphaeria hispida]